MILSTHALVGAAVGKHVSNPWLIVLITLPLHFLFDTFRHGEYLNRKSTFTNTWWKVALDLFIGLGIVFSYLLYASPASKITQNVLLGTFSSMFPDLLTVLYWKLNFKFLKKIYQLNKFVHSRFPDESPEREWNLRNAVNDIVFSLIAIFFLFL